MRMVTSNTLKRPATRLPGIPIGSTSENLAAAIAGETHEYTDMYPGYGEDST